MSHTVLLRSDGYAVACGRNNYGQLGSDRSDAERGHTSSSPNRMYDIRTVNLGTGMTAVSVDCGMYHTCAVLSDGTAKCWGYNGYGNLGLGSYTTWGDSPSEMGDSLPTLTLGQPAVDVSAGWDHACAVLLDGTLKCWGHNNYCLLYTSPSPRD